MEMWIFYGAAFGSDDPGNYTPQLFFNREDAIDYLKMILSDLTNDGYWVIDEEFDEKSYEEKRFISCLCFYEYQENWNCYCDFSVEPIKAR